MVHYLIDSHLFKFMIYFSAKFRSTNYPHLASAPFSGFQLNEKKHNTFVAFFFIVVSSVFLFLQPAHCLTPEEILVVYNQNTPESKEVAEYYAAKRQVPASNLIAVSLPDSETIPRSKFNAGLCARLSGPVNTLMDNGRKPVILLVYGIPIRISEDAKYDTEGFRNKADVKIQELGSLVDTLTARLEKLIAPLTTLEQSSPLSPPHLSDPSSLLQRAKDAVNKASGIKMDSENPELPAGTEQEIASIVFQLAGITPLAEAIAQQRTANGLDSEKERDAISHWAGIINIQLAHLSFQGLNEENAFEIASLLRISRGLIGEFGFWAEAKQVDIASETTASVDSELTMLLVPQYAKFKWLLNPFLDQFNAIPAIDRIRNQTIMVARLDGPSPEIAKRLVDDALWTEEHGLEGVFYIDARGMNNTKNNDYYANYDNHLRNLHQILSEKSSIKTVIDNKPELFPEQCCDNAALYCGWYSLTKYVDSFRWQRGAVGFHIASGEAKTLKKVGSEVWCKRMLEEGVAATLGPVEEPYLQSFPLPDVFFPLLMTGKIPLVEVYYRSTPFLSWRQIMIADPMYTPFRKKPALKTE